ncbi:MAG: hypothetical protein EXQ63_03860 [Ilumatobacteraceae bacterium]|nr:hypothetical protein [Ilumatobacteraceae bacterium]
MSCSFLSQLQKIDLSKITCTDIDLQAVLDSDAVKQAKEAGYTAVGFGVLAFQRIQVLRQEMATAHKARSNTAQ